MSDVNIHIYFFENISESERESQRGYAGGAVDVLGNLDG